MRRAIIAAGVLAGLQPHGSLAGGGDLTPHMIGLILAAEQPCALHLDQPAFGTYAAEPR